MKDTETKLRPILLTAIMVASVFAIGIALTGTAAATSATVSSTDNGDTVLVGSYNESLGLVTFSEDQGPSEWGSAGPGSFRLPSSTSVTFNQSQSDIQNSWQVSNGSLSDIKFTSNKRVKFNYSGLNSDGTDNIKFNNLVLDVPTDAGNDGDTVSITTNIGAGVSPGSATVHLNSTTADFDNNNDIQLQLGGTNIDGDIIEINDTTDIGGTIASGTTVSVSIKSGSGVTFNQSESLNVNGAGALDGELTNPRFSGPQTIKVDVSANSDGGDDGIAILTGSDGVEFDTQSDASTGTVNLDVTTTPTQSLGNVETQLASSLNVIGPTLNTNWDEAATPEHPVDITIFNDNDGETQIDPDPIAGMNTEQSYNDINVTSGTGNDIVDPSKGTNITVTIPAGTGLTFDQSVGSLDGSNSEGLSNVDPVLVDERTINITIPAQGGTTSAIVDNVRYNVSGGVSSSVQLEATINRTGVSITSEDWINISVANPDPINASADVSEDGGNNGIGPDRDGSNHGDYNGTDSPEATTSLNIGDSVTSSVYVDNVTLDNDGSTSDPSNYPNTAYGGAQVDLEIVQTPSGATGQSVSSSTLTTNSNGFKNFTFTVGNKVGTYIVNASTSTDSVNITYDVTAGSATQFNATNLENALKDTSGLSTPKDRQVAIVKVRVEDSGGNLNSSSDLDFDFSVELSGDAKIASSFGETGVAGDVSSGSSASSAAITHFSGNDYNYDADNGSGDPNPGTFFVFAKDVTPEDADITVSSANVQDTATTTFFDTPDSVEVQLEDTNAQVDDTINVTAFAETSGTKIMVPRLSTKFNSTNTTVAENTSMTEPYTIQTDSSGEAATMVTAQENGTTDITAEILNTQGSNTLTVQPVQPTAPANFSLSELNAPDNITAGQNFDVSVNVTNVGDEQGTQDVEFRFDLDENSTLESDETVNSTSLNLNAGQSSIVTFNITDTAGLNGTFNHGFFTDNSSLTTTIEIRNVSEEPPEEVYDTNNNGQIDGPEVRQAIRCFLFGTDCIGDQLNGQEVRAVISDFLFG